MPFRHKLEAALKAKGHDVAIANAGVSGDTTAGGLARLDWSVPDGTDGVILELGANDALRGIAPEETAEEPRRDDRTAQGARHPGPAGRHAGAAEHGRATMPSASTRSIRSLPRSTGCRSIRSSSTAW